MWSSKSQHNCSGISPINMLPLRHSCSNDDILSPIHLGITPENLLFPRSREYNLVQFCKLEESSPIRLLSPNINCLREDIEHIHHGIPLESLFFDRSSWYKSFQFFGMSPDKLLFERSIASKPFSLLHDEGMLPFNKLLETRRTSNLDEAPMFKGIDPENKLFSKNNHFTLNQSGSQPSNLLKLKSTKNVVELKDNELGSFPNNWFLERSMNSISSFQSHSGIVSEMPTFLRTIMSSPF